MNLNYDELIFNFEIKEYKKIQNFIEILINKITIYLLYKLEINLGNYKQLAILKNITKILEINRKTINFNDFCMSEKYNKKRD